jgi:hypothetical protein
MDIGERFSKNEYLMTTLIFFDDFWIKCWVSLALNRRVSK